MRRWARWGPISPPYLPYISRVSPVYLPLQGFHATVGAMGDMAISTDEARLLLSL